MFSQLTVNLINLYYQQTEQVEEPIEPSEFRHHDYVAMTSFMKRLSGEYPELTRMYSVGKSAVGGREQWVMEISDNPGTHEPGKKN